MSTLDLADIRAQLRAAAPERRPRRGPFSAIRSLIAPSPPPPLLGPPPDYGARPTPVPPPTPEDDDEALLLEAPLELELRRQAFGQRSSGERPVARAAQPQPEIVIVEAGEVGEALKRLRSSLAPRVEHDAEIPFLPEDFADETGRDAEQLYAEAGLPTAAGLPLEAVAAAPPQPPRPTAGEALLLNLERRLTEEQLGFIAVLAGRGRPET